MAGLNKSDDQLLLQRMARYCAFRERCECEVRAKLADLGVLNQQADDFVRKLKAENFIDDQRFLESFVRGKFRNNKWGRNRIKLELQQRGFSDADISDSFEFIPEEEYISLLKELLLDKFNHVHEPDIYVKRSKVAAYVIRKGFEPDLVWEHLKPLK